MKFRRFLLAVGFVFASTLAGCSPEPTVPQHTFDEQIVAIYNKFISNGGTGSIDEWLDSIIGEHSLDYIPTISQGENGNWLIDGFDTGLRVDETTEEYFQVRYELSGGTMPEGYSTNFSVLSGSTLDLPTPTYDGHKFDGWYIGSIDDPTNPLREWLLQDQVTSDLVLIAHWIEIQFNIIFELNGGTMPEGYELSGDISWGSTLDLPVPTFEAHQFEGWYVGSEDDPNNPLREWTAQDPVFGDLVLSARWSEIRFNVIYNPNGGTMPEGSELDISVLTGSTLKLPTPIYNGYAFDGWYVESENDSQNPLRKWTSGDEVTGDLVLIAHWSEIQYKIDYDLKGGVNSEDNPTGFTVTSPSFSLKEPTKDGSMFLGWTTEENNVPQKEITIDVGTAENLSFTANWFETSIISSNESISEADLEDIDYINFYYLDINEDNIFTLAIYTIYSSGSVTCEAECGKVTKNGDIFVLNFSNPELADRYVKLSKGEYLFCDENGVLVSDIGNSGRDIMLENSIPPYIDSENLYGYQDLNTFQNAEGMQRAYNKLWEECEKLVKNTSDLEDLSLAELNLNEFHMNFNDFATVFKLFLLDNPQYYFVSQTISGYADYVYVTVEEDYRLYSTRATIDSAIKAMIDDCAMVLTDGENELDRVLAIHDYVAGRLDYAYEDDGVTPSNEPWAHSIVGAAMYHLGVCESYTETFHILCKAYGIDCLEVSGYGGNEAHVWNLASIDGEWYCVDTTWDDNKEDVPSHGFFGQSYSAMNEYHFVDSHFSVGIDYLYQLPKMSTSNIDLVFLDKGEVAIGYYKNIDDAFAAMNDKDADYTIELERYDMSSGPLLLSSPRQFNSYVADWPEVNSITIRGNFYDLQNGYFTESMLLLNTETNFHSDIILNNARLLDYVNKSPRINTLGHSIKTLGYHCSLLDGGIIYFDGGNLYVETSYETDICSLNGIGNFYLNNYVTAAEAGLICDTLIACNHCGYRFNGGGTADISEIVLNDFSVHFDIVMAERKDEAPPVEINVGNIKGNERFSFVRFSVRTSVDESLPTINILGTVTSATVFYDLSCEIHFLITDLGGNEIATYSVRCKISAGSLLLHAPLCDPSVFDFSLHVLKDENGNYYSEADVGGEIIPEN